MFQKKNIVYFGTVLVLFMGACNDKKAEPPICLDSPKASPARLISRDSWLTEFQNQARACRPELIHKLLLLLYLLLTFFLLVGGGRAGLPSRRLSIKNFSIYYRAPLDTWGTAQSASSESTPL